MNLLLACFIAYLIGAFPISRRRKVLFPTDHSMFRTFRTSEFIEYFILDLLKGALAVAIAWLIGGVVAAHLSILFVVLGELCPCFPSGYPRYGWTVAAGGLLVVSPILILISLGVYLLSLLLTRYLVWSTFLALLAFLLCLIVFSVHLYLWLIIISVAGMLVLNRTHWRRKGWHLPGWKKWR